MCRPVNGSSLKCTYVEHLIKPGKWIYKHAFLLRRAAQPLGCRRASGGRGAEQSSEIGARRNAWGRILSVVAMPPIAFINGVGPRNSHFQRMWHELH